MREKEVQIGNSGRNQCGVENEEKRAHPEIYLYRGLKQSCPEFR